MRNHELIVTDKIILNLQIIIIKCLTGVYKDDNFCSGCFNETMDAKFCDRCEQPYCQFCDYCLACRKVIEIPVFDFSTDLLKELLTIYY